MQITFKNVYGHDCFGEDARSDGENITTLELIMLVISQLLS